MAASDTYLNQALDGAFSGTTAVGAFVSLHTAAPSTAGSNETTGGSYARLAATWNAAATHAKTNSSSFTFTTGGVTAITHAGTFSASTAGTFGIGITLGSSVTAVTITVAAGALSISGAAT